MALLRGSKGHEADLVLLPVVDIRKLVRRPVLTPTHCGVTVEDQGGMGLAVPHDRFRRFNFRKVRKPVRHDASPTARALPALELIQGSPGITVDRTMHLEQQGLTTDQLERRIAAKLITVDRDLAEGDQTEGDQTERDQTEGDQTEGA